MNKLEDVIDKRRIPYLICIGTDMSYIDGIAPRIGSKMSKYMKVLGVKGDNLDNVTLPERQLEIDGIDTNIYQPIAIDCAFHHNYRGTEQLVIYENGLVPSSYLGRDNKKVGEIGVGINVSPIVSSFDEFLTPKKRRDIYAMELQIEVYLLKIIDKYPLGLRIAILLDNGWSFESILAELRITNDEYEIALRELEKTNIFIYERLCI